jgi:hypothetical protein
MWCRAAGTDVKVDGEGEAKQAWIARRVRKSRRAVLVVGVMDGGRRGVQASSSRTYSNHTYFDRSTEAQKAGGYRILDIMVSSVLFCFVSVIPPCSLTIQTEAIENRRDS